MPDNHAQEYFNIIADELHAIAEKCKKPLGQGPTDMEVFHGLAMIAQALRLKYGLPEDTEALVADMQVVMDHLGRGDLEDFAEWWGVYVHESLKGREGFAKAVVVDELIVLRAYMAKLGVHLDEVPDTVEADHIVGAWARVVLESTNDPDRTRTHLERWAKA